MPEATERAGNDPATVWRFSTYLNPDYLESPTGKQVGTQGGGAFFFAKQMVRGHLTSQIAESPKCLGCFSSAS